jgi:hypothetical protein
METECRCVRTGAHLVQATASCLENASGGLSWGLIDAKFDQAD